MASSAPLLHMQCASYPRNAAPVSRFLPCTAPRDSCLMPNPSLLNYAFSNSTVIGVRRSSRKLLVEARAGKSTKNLQTKVVPDPDYRIPFVLIGATGVLIYSDNLLAAAPIGLLGLLLLFQTTRVRFVFDNEALEVKIGEELQESGENVFVGGKNRWKYEIPDFSYIFFIIDDNVWYHESCGRNLFRDKDKKSSIMVFHSKVFYFCELGTMVAKFSRAGLFQRNSNKTRRPSTLFSRDFQRKAAI